MKTIRDLSNEEIIEKIEALYPDMELTEIIKEGYDNYHFRETITDDDVIFDYKLRKGASRTRNAIKLLEVMNFENIVVNDAIKLYEDFILNKQWNKA